MSNYLLSSIFIGAILAVLFLLGVGLSVLFLKKSKPTLSYVLCGFHASTFLKPGMLGVLDAKNCFLCKKKKAA